MTFTACTYRVSAKALVVQASALLMIREHGYWDLPGGGIEHFETPIEALRREVKEELGVPISYVDSDPLKTWTLYDKEYNWPLLFLAYDTQLQSTSGSLAHHLHSPAVRFFGKEELRSATLAPYLDTVRSELIALT